MYFADFPNLLAFHSRGYNPWIPVAVFVRLSRLLCLLRGFKGPGGSTDSLRNAKSIPSSRVYLWMIQFQTQEKVKQEREPFPGDPKPLSKQ